MTEDGAARIAQVLVDSGLIDHVSEPVLAAITRLIADGVLHAEPTKQSERR